MNSTGLLALDLPFLQEFTMLWATLFDVLIDPVWYFPVW